MGRHSDDGFRESCGVHIHFESLRSHPHPGHATSTGTKTTVTKTTLQVRHIGRRFGSPAIGVVRRAAANLWGLGRLSRAYETPAVGW